MLRRASAIAQFLLFALALVSGRAAAAPEGGTQEAAQPAQPADDRSYLPPWMQKREMAGIADSTTPITDGNTSGAAPKTQAPGQNQHPRRHRSDFLQGFKFWNF
jgi:hypothetical protein